MKNKILFFAFLFFLFNCTNKQIEEKNKKEIERIISLLPYISEEIYLLQSEEKLVGVTKYCTRPEQIKEKEKIGDIINVNIEKIYELKPDIIFASTLLDKRTYNKLKELNLNIIVFKEPKNFNEICEQFLEVAKYLNKEKEAKKILDEAKKKLLEVNNKKYKKQLKMIVQIGANPIFIATKESFIHSIIEYSGFINAGADFPNYQAVSREQIILTNPDIIIIIDMGVQTEEEIKTWKKFNNLNAVKNNKIFSYDATKLCSPTPISFIEIVYDIIKLCE
ncbi:MAG TPA: helical backbone metal receptor [bacterium]|nr:helical backbone metal receptor [bacterium]HOL46878.1 helical backbone metal receptor [bacterium]HPQ18773.1 helical backbone metal receptor [bacterium]